MCGSLCLEERAQCRVPSLPLGRDFPGYLSGGQERGQHGDRDDLLEVRGSGSGGPGFRSHLCTSVCVSSGKSFPLSERSFLLYRKGKVGSL